MENNNAIVEAEVKSLVEQAKTVVIKTEQENQVVANRIVAAREMLKTVEDKIMAPARIAKRNATANVSNLEALFVKPIEEALTYLRSASGNFIMAERARREELQRKEDAKVAEAQRKADEKAAEAQRKIDEAYAAKCAKAEAANKPPPAAPVYAPAPAIVAPARVIAQVQTVGVSYGETFFAEVVDIIPLCRAIADGKADSASVLPAMPFLNAIAKAHKAKGKEILPGVFCRSKPRLG